MQTLREIATAIYEWKGWVPIFGTLLIWAAIAVVTLLKTTERKA